MSDRQVYPAVGRCIYCGATSYEPQGGARLGDEHIIPEGLAGVLLLKEASCQRCEIEINRFETRVLRRTFEPARTYFQIRSKKRRPRPTELGLGVSDDGANFTWRDVPLEDYPFTMGLPAFESPGILRGAQPTADMTALGINQYLSPGFLKKSHAAALTPLSKRPSQQTTLQGSSPRLGTVSRSRPERSRATYHCCPA